MYVYVNGFGKTHHLHTNRDQPIYDFNFTHYAVLQSSFAYYAQKVNCFQTIILFKHMNACMNNSLHVAEK